MVDLSLSVVIARSGADDLEVNDPDNGFLVAKGVQIEDVVMRRGEIESPFVPGTYYSYQVQDQTNLSMGVQVSAGDHLTIHQRINTLLNAVKQDEFEITFTLEGQSSVWTCYRANYAVSMRNEGWNARKVLVGLDIPRNPIPVSGVF